MAWHPHPGSLPLPGLALGLQAQLAGPLILHRSLECREGTAEKPMGLVAGSRQPLEAVQLWPDVASSTGRQRGA